MSPFRRPVSAAKNSVPGSGFGDWFDPCVGSRQFGPDRLHHPVFANHPFPSRRQIGRFFGDFRPTYFPDFGLCRRSRFFVMIFGALSLHPKIPFPAAGLEREIRSEEHTSELQSHSDLVCRLLLEKKTMVEFYRPRISTTGRTRCDPS